MYYQGSYAGIKGLVPAHVVSAPYMCYPNHYPKGYKNGRGFRKSGKHLKNEQSHLRIVGHSHRVNSAAADSQKQKRNEKCENSCSLASDGICEDGGVGSSFSLCKFGTDCADCGSRHATKVANATDFGHHQPPALPLPEHHQQHQQQHQHLSPLQLKFKRVQSLLDLFIAAPKTPKKVGNQLQRKLLLVLVT